MKKICILLQLSSLEAEQKNEKENKCSFSHANLLIKKKNLLSTLSILFSNNKKKRRETDMKKENFGSVYSNYDYITKAPKNSASDSARASVSRTERDLRGGKK